MKNAKANRNFTTKNLQTDVTRIWLVSLKHLNNIINECLNFFFIIIGNMLVFKTYIVSLAHFGWINHINEYELIIDFEIKNKLNII